MVNSNNQDPFIKRLFLIGAGILCFPFHWLYSLLFLYERLGSSDGAELSNNPIKSNQNSKDDVSSSAKNSETDENSDDVFEPVQPMNFDDPINPNNINSPLSPLNPLNQTNPTSPYYHGDDLLDPSNPLNYNNPASPFCHDDSNIDLFSESSSQDLFSGDSFGDGLGSVFDDSFSSGFGSGFDDHFQ